MRGAVSVALVYLYYDPDGTSDDKQKSSLISATLTVVLFSTLVYGAITKPMLDLLLGAAGAVQCPCLFSPGWLPHSYALLCVGRWHPAPGQSLVALRPSGHHGSSGYKCLASPHRRA